MSASFLGVVAIYQKDVDVAVCSRLGAGQRLQANERQVGGSWLTADGGNGDGALFVVRFPR